MKKNNIHKGVARMKRLIPPAIIILLWLICFIAAAVNPPMLGDSYAEVCGAAANTVAAALLAGVLQLALGVLYGCAAGMAPSPVSGILRSLALCLQAIPAIALITLFTLLFGFGFQGLVLALGLAGAPAYSGRAAELAGRIKKTDFSNASRLLGGGGLWIIRRHILPNTVLPLIPLFFSRMTLIILEVITIEILGMLKSNSLGEILMDGVGGLRLHADAALLAMAITAVFMLLFNITADTMKGFTQPDLKGGLLDWKRY